MTSADIMKMSGADATVVEYRFEAVTHVAPPKKTP